MLHVALSVYHDARFNNSNANYLLSGGGAISLGSALSLLLLLLRLRLLLRWLITLRERYWVGTRRTCASVVGPWWTRFYYTTASENRPDALLRLNIVSKIRQCSENLKTPHLFLGLARLDILVIDAGLLHEHHQGGVRDAL